MNFKAFFLVAVSVTVFMTGCSSPRSSAVSSVVMKRNSHEIQMKKSWVGRSYAELAEAKGSKGMTMAIPGTGMNSANFVVLYDTDPGSGCIDAFTVAKGESAIIQDYFCR